MSNFLYGAKARSRMLLAALSMVVLTGAGTGVHVERILPPSLAPVVKGREGCRVLYAFGRGFDESSSCTVVDVVDGSRQNVETVVLHDSVLACLVPNAAVDMRSSKLSIAGHPQPFRLSVDLVAQADPRDDIRPGMNDWIALQFLRSANVYGVMSLVDPLDTAALRHLVEAIITHDGKFRKFACVMDPTGAWHPFPIDLNNHIFDVAMRGGDEEELDAFLHKLAEIPMDYSLPPWQMWVLSSRATSTSTLVFKASHMISDGTGLVAFLQE